MLTEPVTIVVESGRIEIWIAGLEKLKFSTQGSQSERDKLSLSPDFQGSNFELF